MKSDLHTQSTAVSQNDGLSPAPNLSDGLKCLRIQNDDEIMDWKTWSDQKTNNNLDLL